MWIAFRFWTCSTQTCDLSHSLFSRFWILTYFVFSRYQDLTTTLQDWGAKVRAVHIAGAYWAPGFANYLILLQVFYHPSSKPSITPAQNHQTQRKMQATDIFTYNMTHCPGAENTATASALLDIIVRWFLLFLSFSCALVISPVIGVCYRGLPSKKLKPKNYIVL